MNELAEKIRLEIAERGPISFARFMESALYDRDWGYYEQEDRRIGRAGDFYTSVNIGPLFGELIAFQSARWLDELASDGGTLSARSSASSNTFQFVEAGAHDGRLACDILSWYRLRRPEIFAELQYWIIEPSLRRERWQIETLAEFAGRVQWFRDWTYLPNRIDGIIFSNELLDAFPVHRLGWDAKKGQWFEWGVDWKDDQFISVRLENATPSLASANALRYIDELPGELLAVMPDGFITEISPGAESWWKQAAESLHRGKLVTVDYGMTANERLAPEKGNGTLRGYRKHRIAEDLLADPGEQDLTAHVNFSALQEAGEGAGLRTEALISQAQWLTQIAEGTSQPGANFGEWTLEKRRQFQTLVHPEHLGRSFRALIQSR